MTEMRDDLQRLGERLWPDTDALRPQMKRVAGRTRTVVVAVATAVVVAAAVAGGTLVLHSRGVQPAPAHAAPVVGSAVPWIDAPVHDAATASTLTGVPPCHMTDLRVNIPNSPYVGGGMLNSQWWGFTVTDASSHACYLARAFDVRFELALSRDTVVSLASGPPLVNEILYLAPLGHAPSPRYVTEIDGEIGYGPCRLDHLRALVLSIAPFPESKAVVPGAAGGVTSCAGGTKETYYSEFSDSVGSSWIPWTITTIAAPTVVHAGEHVRFTATIQDAISPYRHCALACPTALPQLPWTPCPTYHEELQGVPGSLHAYTLNCATAGPLYSKQSRAFDMYIDVPADAATGPAVLAWELDGPQPQSVYGPPPLYGPAYAQVVVEPPSP